MKINKLLSLLAAFTVAFTFLACDSGSGSDDTEDSLNGTWKQANENSYMKLDSGNVEMSMSGLLIAKGAYLTAAGNKITMTITYINGDFLQLFFESEFEDLSNVNVFESKLYMEEELKERIKSKSEEVITAAIAFLIEEENFDFNDFSEEEKAQWKAEAKADFEEKFIFLIESMLISSEGTYSIKNNKLTITYSSGETETYTRE